MSAAPDSPEVLERFHSTLQLVDAIARRLARSMGPHAELDELTSLGQEGLLEAARRFDPDQGVPFRSYASYRVRGAMIDGVRKNSQVPRAPHQKLRAVEAAGNYCEGLAQDHHGPPPPGETRSDALRLLDDHLANMATAMAVGLISETATGEDGEATNLSSGASPEEAVEQAQLRQLVREQIDALPHEEQQLLRRHYFEGERFDRVASELGMSKSWASRLHARAIGRLTKRLRGVA